MDVCCANCYWVEHDDGSCGHMKISNPFIGCIDKGYEKFKEDEKDDMEKDWFRYAKKLESKVKDLEGEIEKYEKLFNAETRDMLILIVKEDKGKL